MLIDFHTHCFPDKIAPKAIEKLSFTSSGLTHYTDGTHTPWHTPEMEKRLLGTLGINGSDMDKITHKNAQKLLGVL